MSWQDELRAQLAGADDAPARLRALVSWFDLAIINQPGGASNVVSLQTQSLARATAAAGRVLLRHEGWGDSHPVARTLAAADEYIRQPTEDTYDMYQDAATNSFPFGPGDGCLGLPGFEDHHTPGSGCTSGSGTLDAIAHTLGAEAVLKAIREELL